MALGSDDFKLTLTLTDDFSQNYINTFYYKGQAATGDAEDLWGAFEEDIMSSIGAILSVTADTARMQVINLGDDGDFYEAPSTNFTGGGVAGEALPSFVSSAFRIERPIRTIRHGRKSFGPVAEGSVADGVATSGYKGLCDTFAGILETPLFLDTIGNDTYDICIPKTELVNPLDPSQGYEITSLVVAQAVSFVRISHQVSRWKYK